MNQINEMRFVEKMIQVYRERRASSSLARSTTQGAFARLNKRCYILLWRIVEAIPFIRDRLKETRRKLADEAFVRRMEEKYEREKSWREEATANES